MALLHSCQVTTEQRPVHIQVVVFLSCNTWDSAYFISRQTENNFFVYAILITISCQIHLKCIMWTNTFWDDVLLNLAKQMSCQSVLWRKLHVPTAFRIAILYIKRKITHTSRLASAFVNKNETIYWELLN